MQMQEVNWGNFKAKFDGKEQKSFESLCYQLFCFEFGIDIGIFRYKNQIGIETDPIEINGEVIGWQAKFLETNISRKTRELKENIQAAKTKNPSLTKVLFYLNQEFSESRKEGKKEPKYKTEIEDFAERLGVKAEWRVPSYFETQLKQEKNAALAQHFFGLGESIIDFVRELCLHTESILDSVSSNIVFNGKKIKIDRGHVCSNLLSGFDNVPVIVLSGAGGTGKTAVVKDLYNEHQDTTLFFVFKGWEFLKVASVNELFKRYGSFTFSDFLKETKNQQKKYMTIDAAEKLSELGNAEVFKEFLKRVVKSGWSIIFTTRYALDPLEQESVELYGDSFEVIQIRNISKQQLDQLGIEYGFARPQNERFLNLLLTPFYLNEYLESYESSSELKTYSGFKKSIWEKKIQGSSHKDYIHRRRETCFIEIATRRADSGSFYIKSDDLDQGALFDLESDEVIKYDRGNFGVYITHDIYEEWAFNKIIEREFNICTDYRSFLQSFGSSLPILRAFRIWLSEQLLFDADKVKRLIEESICEDQIEGFWKDEILISILLSEHPATFFHDFETKLLDDNGKLLKRIILLLRMACKQIDEDLLQCLGIQHWEGAAYDSAFTMPRGRGWEFAVDFIHRHKKELGLQSVDTVLSLLSDWNNKFIVGDSTKKASQVGLYFYEQISTNRGSRHFRKDTENLIIRVILQGSGEIKNELSKIFEEVLAAGSTSYSDKYYGIVKTVLCSLTDGIEAVKTFPEYVRRLADLFWFQIPENEFSYFVFNIEHYFCITEKHDFTYFPASFYQTPIFQLLRYSPDETIDFIISFVNRAVTCYAKFGQKNGLEDDIEEIKLTFDDGRSAKQFISKRLWSMYRGTAVSTYLLESIHMALEKYLLEEASSEVLESQCEHILRQSRSASLTAVVASVVCSQPNKLFNVAKTLFRTKELFHYDLERLSSDQSWKSSLLTLKQISSFEDRIHYNERIKACDADHRNLSVENIAFQYQLAKSKDDPEVEKRREDVWAILDEHYNRLPPESEQTDDDMTWRLS